MPLEGPPDRCQASSHPHRQSKESLVGETAVKAALGVAKAVLDSVRCATKSPKRA